MTRAVTIVIAGPPTAKGRPRMTRKGFAYTPAATRKYEAHGRLAAQLAMDGRPPLTVGSAPSHDRGCWTEVAARTGTDWPGVIDGCRDLLAVAVGENANIDADLDRHRFLDDHVTMAAASAKQRKNRPTPATVVEALMYSLRRGVNDLTRPHTLRRLSALDDTQLKAVCRRVQNFKPEIATAWSPEEVAALIARWKESHG